MRLIGAGQYQNQRAEALLEQLVAEGYIQAIDTLLALYQPGWGWQPNPEKYTKYLIQGANWEGKVTDREDEQTLRRTQARLAYAYLSGQDEKNYSGRMQNGTYVKDTKYRQSSLPKDIEKACYWLEKSLQGKDRSDSVAIASMVENCPIRAAQLGFGAADKERAEQDLKRSFDEYQQRRRFRNSPEGQVRHREKELEQEETDRRYEEAKRQDAQAQREFLGQAAGMLGQVLQNKRGAGDR
ncbi:MAG: hypothetical protein OEY28_07300 [Nitrospira sp.]|nr:hypothetical protein [Nitrospira sp.]